MKARNLEIEGERAVGTDPYLSWCARDFGNLNIISVCYLVKGFIKFGRKCSILGVLTAQERSTILTFFGNLTLVG